MKRFLPLMIWLGACSPEPEAPRQFSLMDARETGIDFRNDLSDEQLDIIEYLYFYNGGGAAIGDLNNDGLPEVIFTANQTANQVYLNQGNFQFKNISDQVFESEKETWSNGVALGDVNGDGLLDIYISQVSNYKTIPEGQNLLYINQGNLKFKESAAEMGLAFSGFSTHAAFFDYDLDGDLDMYLLNHAVHTNRSYSSAKERINQDNRSGDRLYKNLLNETGKAGFEDVTQDAGIYSSLLGYGLGIGISDVNGDYWPDIYVSNDFHENDYLYINQQDGTFKEEGASRIPHMSRFSMGNDIADINGDGQMDIFTLDMLPEDPSIMKQSGGEDSDEVYAIKIENGYHHQYSRNTMQINEGGLFKDLALLNNTYATDWSWSVLIADYDLDTKNELFVSNGIYKRPNDLDYINFASNLQFSEYARLEGKAQNEELIKRMPTMKLSNFVFKQSDSSGYDNVSTEWNLDQTSYSHGAAYGDLDGDGDLDLIVNNTNEPAFVYRNNNLDNRLGLQLKLEGKPGNIHGIGASVEVHTAGNVQHKEVYLSRGFQSSSESTLIFGVSQNPDSVKVYWGGSASQVFQGLKMDDVNVLSYDPVQTSTAGPASDIEIRSLPFTHLENNYDDLDYESLMPYRLSKWGPALAVGDVNGDGTIDLYLGGARNQPGALLLKKGKDFQSKNIGLNIDQQFEDVAAELFDADGDQDLDLIVISGGNEARQNQLLYQHRLYLNDGQGNFQRDYQAFPQQVASNGSCVMAEDLDNDGDMDLFIGSLSIPGIYGLEPASFLLLNNGSGKFSIANDQLPNNGKLGMITSVGAFDSDQDDQKDLAVAGHWMPVTILKNTSDGFIRESIPNTAGWWNSITVADVNQDGKEDLLAGNLGLNSKLKASTQEPVTLYLSDFDRNGQLEPILFHFYQGAHIPFHSRDELSGQVPELKKRFLSYQDFAKVRSIETLFPAANPKTMRIQQVVELGSALFLNEGNGTYAKHQLPEQTGPINDFAIELKEEGILIHTVGNRLDYNVNQGRYTGMAYSLYTFNAGTLTKEKGTLRMPFNKTYNRMAWLDEEVLVITTNDGPAYQIIQ
ncbi:MAG: VCBS repeat-containing protein [Cytophagales bacterium]|nr:VCBS repeat-containing protein [Cytophagales bacterium]